MLTNTSLYEDFLFEHNLFKLQQRFLAKPILTLGEQYEFILSEKGEEDLKERTENYVKEANDSITKARAVNSDSKKRSLLFPFVIVGLSLIGLLITPIAIVSIAILGLILSIIGVLFIILGIIGHLLLPKDRTLINENIEKSKKNLKESQVKVEGDGFMKRKITEILAELSVLKAKVTIGKE